MAQHILTLRAVALVFAAAFLLVATPSGARAADQPALTGVVNVNTATLDELQLLPGVGPSRAVAILEARKQRGGFRALEELVEVKGIGPAGLERMRPFVVLDGRTTASLP